MNVFEMYVAHGNKAGFYVVRDSWDWLYAYVLTVAGKKEGPLPGEPPYHTRPDGSNARVWCQLFDRRTGNRHGAPQELTCPGTGAYTMYERPPVYRKR